MWCLKGFHPVAGRARCPIKGSRFDLLKLAFSAGVSARSIKMGKNRANRPSQVTDEQIEAMANLGVSAEKTTDPTVAERAGSDDKVGAVIAEGAKPKVKTFTPEGREWMQRDPYGLKTEGLYGKKGQTPLQPEMAPQDGVTCPICNELVTSFVRTALIDRTTGDLVRDRNDGHIIYRGQFVAVGPDGLNLKVYGAHPGECLFRLRVRRDRNGNAMSETYTNGQGQERQRWVLLDAQSFDQANARVAAVRLSILAKRDQREADNARVKQVLGFKVGDAARGPRTDDGIDRGSYAPRTPRGQSRKTRRWIENEDAE